MCELQQAQGSVSLWCNLENVMDAFGCYLCEARAREDVFDQGAHAAAGALFALDMAQQWGGEGGSTIAKV